MKNKTRVALFAAGVVGVFFTLMHGMMFYGLLTNSLISPDPLGIQALVQTFNSVTLWVVAAMAFFSFRYPDELAGTPLGKSILMVFGIFYLVRIASEFVFVGYSGAGSLVIVVLCLIPALSYLAAAIAPSQRRAAVPQV